MHNLSEKCSGEFIKGKFLQSTQIPVGTCLTNISALKNQVFLALKVGGSYYKWRCSVSHFHKINLSWKDKVRDLDLDTLLEKKLVSIPYHTNVLQVMPIPRGLPFAYHLLQQCREAPFAWPAPACSSTWFDLPKTEGILAKVVPTCCPCFLAILLFPSDSHLRDESISDAKTTRLLSSLGLTVTLSLKMSYSGVCEGHTTLGLYQKHPDSGEWLELH